MGKFKIGDRVRIRESSEELVITNLFTKTFTYYDKEDIEEYADLENDAQTQKYTVITDNIYLTNMSVDEMKRRFFDGVIRFEMQTEIKKYENVTGDKVEEIRYVPASDEMFLTTKKLSTIVI